MASTDDLLLLRKTVESVKTLEQVALAKDFNNFLNAARELSDNVVKLVQMALANNAEAAAGELRESVKQAMGCAKILLRDKTDEALDQFRNYLKEVARVIITITQIVRSQPGAAPGSVAPPVRSVDHLHGFYLGLPFRAHICFSQISCLFFTISTKLTEIPGKCAQATWVSIFHLVTNVFFFSL